MSQSSPHWQDYERQQRARIAQRAAEPPAIACKGCGDPVRNGKCWCVECDVEHRRLMKLAGRKKQRRRRRELAEPIGG